MSHRCSFVIIFPSKRDGAAGPEGPHAGRLQQQMLSGFRLGTEDPFLATGARIIVTAAPAPPGRRQKSSAGSASSAGACWSGPGAAERARAPQELALLQQGKVKEYFTGA